MAKRNAWGDLIEDSGPRRNAWGDVIEAAPARPATPPGQIPVDPRMQAPAAQNPEQMYGGRSISDQIGGGIASALNRTAIGLKGLIPGVETTDDDRRRLAQHRQFVAGTGPASTVGEIGADIAMGAAPVAKGASVLTKTLGRVAPRAAPLAADLAANAGYAAATAPEDRGSAAAWGAGGAAAGRAMGRATTGLVRPTDDAVTLINEGVRLTPGQAAGKGSWVNKAEEYLSSNPVAGLMITPARQRALEDANLAVARSVVKHVDDSIKLGRPATEAIEQVRDRIGQVYDDVLPQMRWPRESVHGLSRQIVQSVPEEFHLVGGKQRQTLSNYFGRRMEDLARQDQAYDQVPGEFLKQIDTELGSYARQLSKSTSAEEKVAAPMWYEAQRQWREQAMKNAAPDSDTYAKLSAANAGYRELLAIEKALKSSGGERIQPRVLAKTLAAAGIKQGSTADLSRAMSATLPNTVPDSGTAGRLMVNAIPMALAGGGATALGAPVIGAGLAAGAALGTQTGTRAMTGQSAAQQAAIQALMRQGLTRAQAEEYVKRAMSQAGRAMGTQAGQ